MKDKIFRILLPAAVIGILLLSCGILFTLMIQSISAFQHLDFIAFDGWFSFLGYGLTVSVLAMIISVPFSIAMLLICIEYCRERKIVFSFVFIMDLFAYIPSVVWGVWAYYNLNLMHDRFGIDPHDFEILSVSIVMALMIIPYFVSICVHYIPFVPSNIEEGAYCLGATRFEIIKTITFPSISKGLMTAALLSLAKILGETTVFVILFGKTVTSALFNRFGTIDDLEFSTLFAMALILFLMTAALNIAAKYMLRRLWLEHKFKEIRHE